MENTKDHLDTLKLLKVKALEQPRGDLESILLRDFRARFSETQEMSSPFNKFLKLSLGIGAPAALAMLLISLFVNKDSVPLKSGPQVVSLDSLEPIIVSTTLPSFHSFPVEF